MSIEIYFDESNKIDEFTSRFSYYGIILCNHSERRVLEDYKLKIGFKDEFHFTKFNLGVLYYYLNIFNYSLDLIKTNIYIVNNEYALNTEKKLNINPTEIRNLLYMKIPERLVYGALRKIPTFEDVDIYIDQWHGYGNRNSEFFSDENKSKFESIISNSKLDDKKKVKDCTNLITSIYDHLQLPKTLKKQLNAQAIYRGLNYKVRKCTQADSKDYVGLQIIDLIIGVFSFLFEEKYLEMPVEIDIEDMENILEIEWITEEEKNLIRNSYKKIYNKNLKKDRYRIDLLISDVRTRSELKELNKRLKLYDTMDIMKAEFVYLILSDNEILKKLLDLNIFIWPEDDSTGNNSTIGKTYISKYIAVFLNFKNQFDSENIKSIITFHNDNLSKPKYKFSDYRNALKYPSRLSNLVKRYLELLGIVWVDKDN